MQFRLIGRGVYRVEARTWQRALWALAARGDLPAWASRPSRWTWDAAQRDRYCDRGPWRLSIVEDEGQALAIAPPVPIPLDHTKRTK